MCKSTVKLLGKYHEAIEAMKVLDNYQESTGKVLKSEVKELESYWETTKKSWGKQLEILLQHQKVIGMYQKSTRKMLGSQKNYEEITKKYFEGLGQVLGNYQQSTRTIQGDNVKVSKLNPHVAPAP